MKNANMKAQTNHQKAVDSLIEIAVSSICGADLGEWSVPPSQVPALFRAAIKEMKPKGDKNPYREETAILEVALPLLEQAKDENWTPELKEFVTALACRYENGKMRMRYAPENVTVN